MHRSNASSLALRLPALVIALATASSAQAGSAYAELGVPGILVGYEQPLDEHFALRADVGGLSGQRTGERNGLDYQAKFTILRAGAFVDWFPFVGSGLRLTTGVTLNHMRLDSYGQGTGRIVTVGNDTYLLTDLDRFDLHMKAPAVTPYVGFGWGAQAKAAAGWDFTLDVGASLGKARVQGQAYGPALSTSTAQADFQQELTDLRKKAADYPFVPQIVIGAGYRF
jgi:hypothetical protein